MKRKELVAIIMMGIVLISIYFFSPRFIVPPQRNTLYTFSSLDVEVYPEYYFTPLDIEPEQEVYVEYSISIGPNDDLQEWAYEMYACDLATFLSHYTPDDDDSDWEFRSDYLRIGGSSTPLSREDRRLGTAAIEGEFILVWWIVPTTKQTPWAVTLSVYTLI